MSESKYTARLCTELRKLGVLVHVNYNGGRFNVPGWPDRLFIFQGMHVHAEFKGEEGKLSKAQQITIRDINAHGGQAYVIREAESGAAASGYVENEAGVILHTFATAGGLLDWFKHDRKLAAVSDLKDVGTDWGAAIKKVRDAQTKALGLPAELVAGTPVSQPSSASEARVHDEVMLSALDYKVTPVVTGRTSCKTPNEANTGKPAELPAPKFRIGQKVFRLDDEDDGVNRYTCEVVSCKWWVNKWLYRVKRKNCIAFTGAVYDKTEDFFEERLVDATGQEEWT